MRVPKDVYERYREPFTRVFELSASDLTCIAAAEMPYDHMIDEHSAVLEGRLALTPSMLPLSWRRVSALSKRLSIRKVTSGEIIALEGFPARTFFISLDAQLLTYRGLDHSVALAFQLSQGDKLPSFQPHSIEDWVEILLLPGSDMISESGETKRVYAAVASDGTFTIDSRGPGGEGSGVGAAAVSRVDDHGGKEECDKGGARAASLESEGGDDDGKSKRKENDVPALTFRFSLRNDLRSVEVRAAPMHATLYPLPYTLYPIPYTLYPVPCTLYPLPSTLYLIPYNLFSVPYTLCPTPYTLYPVPYTLCPTPYTLCPTPYSLYPVPCTLYPILCTLYPIPYTLYPT